MIRDLFQQLCWGCYLLTPLTSCSAVCPRDYQYEEEAARILLSTRSATLVALIKAGRQNIYIL